MPTCERKLLYVGSHIDAKVTLTLSMTPIYLQGIISAWAVTKPLVKRVWMFGSRVRGDHQPDSDLDIAVEIDMAAVRGIDHSGGFATWAFEADSWRSELAALIGLKIDLQYYGRGETRIIQAGLDHSSVLIYEKNCDSSFA